MRLAVLGRRLLAGVLVLWIASVLTFALGRLIPGDPAAELAGPGASPEVIAAIRTELGLDLPLPVQYLRWLGHALQGDLGASLYSGQSVFSALATAAPPTLTITLLAMVFAVVIGVSVGLLAGLRQGSWLDRGVSVLTGAAIAMPSFWAAMLLVSVFAISLRWFPATGYAPLEDGIDVWFSHAALPGLALGLAPAAELARQARSSVADVLVRPYVLTARARGAAGMWFVRRHVLRNAAIPVLTVLGLQTGRLLGGAVVVEAVCGVPGLGTLAIVSVLQNDYPLIQGYVLLCALVVVLVNLVVDMTYSWTNPKLRAA